MGWTGDWSTQQGGSPADRLPHQELHQEGKGSRPSTPSPSHGGPTRARFLRTINAIIPGSLPQERP